MNNISQLRQLIQFVLKEQGHLSKQQSSGMGTNQPFTTKSIKVALGSPGEHSIEDKEFENVKEKVKVSKVFLRNL